MKQKIPYVNIAQQSAAQLSDLQEIVTRVLSEGKFVNGNDVEAFEQNIARYCGARNAIALNSGTDALILALKVSGIGPGDEVITPPNSFIASASAIIQVGAAPVFVDVKDDQNIDPTSIEAAITPATKAILPVHLTGRMCAMDQIMEIATQHKLTVIEDAAQAIGSRYQGKMAGTFGHFGCFSTHPLKNLNAIGDGGFVITNDDKLATRLRRARNHGLVGRNEVLEWGIVSRMDTIQAAILNYRLNHLDTTIQKRRHNASIYKERLHHSAIFVPRCEKQEFNSFHTFVIQINNRDQLKERLKEKGIETAIHYPIPIHLQPAARALGYKYGDFPKAERQSNRILTLPIHQDLLESEIHYICDQILVEMEHPQL